MLFLVLLHHVLHECVVGCSIPSSMYEHVPIYHLIVIDSTPSCTLSALTSHHRVRRSSSLKHLVHCIYAHLALFRGVLPALHNRIYIFSVCGLVHVD